MKPSKQTQEAEIGQLKQRVTLQQRPITGDGRGGMVETWTDIATVWAKIETITYYGLTYGYTNIPTATVKVTTRYQPSWAQYFDFLDGNAQISTGKLHNQTPTMRLKHERRAFKILGVIDKDERHEWLEFNCTEWM